MSTITQIFNATVQAVKDADYAGHCTFAELHPVLELQAELLLTAVIQSSEESLCTFTQWGRRGRGYKGEINQLGWN